MTPRPLDTLAGDDPRWLEVVATHADAQAFHHPAWGRLLQECYGFQPFVLARLADDSRIAAGISCCELRLLGRRRWVSVPFADYCQPLVSDSLVGTRFAAELDATRKAAGVALEVRSALDDFPGFSRVDNVRHTVDLASNAEEVHRSFATMVRKAIRKAEREGVTTRWAETRTDLTNVFYELHTQTRRRLGVPVQPRRFFELFWDHVIEANIGRLLIAEHEGLPIAGTVMLAWNSTLTLKYTASRQEAWSLRPNNLMYWRAIQWGIENGCTLLDFGRTELSAAGLRNWKVAWGAREDELPYSFFADRPPRPGVGRASTLVQPVIRRAPLWVTRVLGETLYRFAG